MELYGRNNTSRNGSQSGHQPQWSPTDQATGLEESMWQSDLKVNESYPQRHGVPDCVFYMRTGVCGYGDRCRYNHPRNRAAVEAAVRATGDYPDRPGEPICQGEKECSYYLKTGQCKFGITCKFHHPQPAGTSLPASAPQFYPPVQSPTVPMAEQYGGASTSLRVARPPLLASSYVQGAYGPVLFSPGVVPFSGWNPYSASVSPVLSPGAQPAVGATSLYGVTQISSSMPALAGLYPSLPSSAGPSSSGQMEQSFPERPGEPECQYFLKTGDCKFGSSCRFHHPRDRVVPRTNCALSPLGLPLRPGAQPCTFYLQNGRCKFGATCKFDHPMGAMRYSPSASSLIETPVAPYPVGSLLSTLAPASSSSDLRPELISGSKKDSLLSRIPSSGNTSSSSVGLIFSQTGSVPLSDLQLSGQSSVPLSSSRSARQGVEVRRLS
ncbi:zinc finger CCCH domain-containing protein 32 [Citrus sinensis]|uniref:Zinc finger CCCH domain-containing protein 32 n=1 Tax=Citrus sinensis TaxID=2711 RepID=A0ACB8MLF3_CITSI|nr:zinc finger CCCH domain-containing protein 32 [Citrus sinensis]KAH9786244.1 zinc finger CCCH domain-containing protein 32 [Citrus sinensis]